MNNNYSSKSDEDKRDQEIFSCPVKAGKRTYFFDVKATRDDDYYLTITESKRKIDSDGKFSYDKHKIFLYKEDFDKFAEGLQQTVNFIKSSPNFARQHFDSNKEKQESTNISFEDL
ncbi:MAG: DUF3276 family protein [Bacteroidales bacterium]